MKHLNWQIVFGIILIVLSALAYYVHFLLFHDAHHIFIYLVGDIAFVFIEVLLVTLILHQLLEARERQSRLKKMNMVIGAFFSEVGHDLVDMLRRFDQAESDLRQHLLIRDTWTKKQFQQSLQALPKRSATLDISTDTLEQLRDFLVSKRRFLLRLLENPNLLEHESFTDLLWAVFHLTEELERRNNLTGLSKTDHKHLTNDVARVYQRVVHQWLDYMSHLNRDYPYLFSLAVRTNPFDPDAVVEFAD